MSLLTICQCVLEEVGNFDVPDSIVGNTNDTARQILALANREGRLLSRRANWSDMNQVHTFPTVASQETYDLPDGFRYYIPSTGWDRTNYWELRGPTSPQDWQELKGGIIVDGTRRWIRFLQGKIWLHPVPTVDGDTIAFEYASKNWCQSDAGVPQNEWLADNDTGIIDEILMHLGLKWRWRAAKELPYAEDYNEYETEVERAIGRDGGMRRLSLHGSRLGVYDVVNLPEGGFG